MRLKTASPKDEDIFLPGDAEISMELTVSIGSKGDRFKSVTVKPGVRVAVNVENLEGGLDKAFDILERKAQEKMRKMLEVIR